MTDETDTTPEGVTDNVELSENDTSEDFDYYDPDEDQDTEVVEATEETEDEADEIEAEDEAPDQEADEDQPEDEPIDDFISKLKAETPRFAEHMEELEKGALRQADYTRKSQELSNERKAVEADAQRIQGITETFIEHLSELVPDAPDASLALSDPNAYTAQKAQHEAAMAQVQKLIELGSAPKEVTDAMSQADRNKLLTAENAKLIEMFPHAASGKGRETFMQNVQSVANDLGFTDQELGSITDHRVFALAHWARVGMEAEKAKTKVKAKAAKAPPATPRKPGQGAAKANRNAEAMRKLKRSGSLEDALAVDFD